MGRLDETVVLVAGGAGQVGEGIVQTLLDDGGTVVVPSRREDALMDLRGRLWSESTTRFVPVVGNVGDADGAVAVREAALDEVGRIDAVVSSLGGWWRGGHLLDTDVETWNQVLADNLTSHFVTARTFLPVLEPGGSYVVLNGPASEYPIVESGAVSVATAGLRMLVEVLVAEGYERGDDVNITQLVPHTPVATRLRTTVEEEWLTGADLGTVVAGLLVADVHGGTVHIERRADVDRWRA